MIKDLKCVRALKLARTVLLYWGTAAHFAESVYDLQHTPRLVIWWLLSLPDREWQQRLEFR